MDSVAEFYSFPFLRDEVFLKLLRAVKVTEGGFNDSVFKAQLAYYQQYINPTFNVALLLAPRTDIPPQCPFSRKRKVGTDLLALEESILKPGLAFYAEGRVSVASSAVFKDPTIRVCKAGQVMQWDSFKYGLFGEGQFELNMNDLSRCEGTLLCSEEASFSLVNSQSELMEALCETGRLFKPADLKCLNMVKSIIIVAKAQLITLANLLVYAEVCQVPLDQVLAGIPLSTEPSRLEPYKDDLLVASFVKENTHLFC